MPAATQVEASERSWLSVIGEYVVIFVVAYLLAFVLQNFLFGIFEIKQHSMESTLYEYDRVFITRLTYKYSDPKRGDVIILLDPMGSQDDFVKRVIALPGEEIAIKNGVVYINGKKLNEPYINSDHDIDNMRSRRIAPEEFFVMGDNRTVSSDSRRFGPIPRSNILGKVLVVFWPPAHSRVLK
jgi:signal peptidase I